MKQTGDLFLVKKINKSIVLDTIRTESPISRAKLSERTGLNKTTVSSLVNELIQDHLVHEIGPGESSGGRKPLLLLFRENAGFAIGLDIRIDAISAILTDLTGTIQERFVAKLDSTHADLVISEVIRCVQELSSRAPESPYGIVGVGVGVPGIVDGSGNVLFAPNLNWSNVPLQSLLAESLELPVVINNEANAGAVGELQFGAGQDARNLLYISVSHGIGTGIILNGELYRGSSGFAGEAGHFSINADGPACSCGNSGCWELYASEKALIRESKSLLAGTSFYEDQMNLEMLQELASQGQTAIQEAFVQLGHYLGVGIANLINLFNPQRIVIGNHIALIEEEITPSMRATVEQRSLSFHRGKVVLEFSALGLDANPLGAAYLALQLFLDKNRISL